MKIGYKGLSDEMTSKLGNASKEVFEIGKTYTKDINKEPRVCSSDGYHYCNNLIDVFKHYPNNNKNRFFKIEVLGKFTDSGDKSVTTSFKLLEEISKEDIEKEILKNHFQLDLLKEFLTEYPMFHVGGSTGLFLHGVRLERWANNSNYDSNCVSDYDLVSPYFVLPEGEFGGYEIDYLDAKASSNDFDDTFILGNKVKVDVRIDPKQRYEIIEFDGFKFKVSNLLTILEAKMRYAQVPSGSKHRDDIIEMVKGKEKKKSESILDLFK